jgi:hypothetical protein
MVALLILTVALAGGQALAAGDAQAIEEVLVKSYVEGVWRQRDPDLVREGFASTFVMQVYWGDELSSRTLDQWLDRMNLDRKPRESEIRADIEVLEVTGIAGLARVDLFEDGKHRYTDYFGLYKTSTDWRIISKMFHSW